MATFKRIHLANIFLVLVSFVFGCVQATDDHLTESSFQPTISPTRILVATSTLEPIHSATSQPTASPTQLPTVPPTSQPTSSPTATTIPTPSPLDGLIFAESFEAPAYIVEYGLAQPLTKYELANAIGANGYEFATNDNRVYIAQGENLFIQTSTERTIIELERIVQNVYGIVGEWLMISSFPPDWTVRQEVGELTAVSLATFEIRVISEDRPYVLPIVAPDGSQLIYWANGEAFSWMADGSVEKRPFPHFRSGAISADGQHITLLMIGEIRIYNLVTNELVAMSKESNCPGDGFCFPVWHPDNIHVAYNVYIPENTPPFALQLLSIDGTFQQFDEVGFPAFSPDGQLMAVYQNDNNHPETAVIQLDSGEKTITSFHGIPLYWDDLFDE